MLLCQGRLPNRPGQPSPNKQSPLPGPAKTSHPGCSFPRLLVPIICSKHYRTFPNTPKKVESSEVHLAGHSHKKPVWEEAKPMGHTGTLGFATSPLILKLLTKAVATSTSMGGNHWTCQVHIPQTGCVHRAPPAVAELQAGRQEALLAETSTGPVNLVSLRDCDRPSRNTPRSPCLRITHKRPPRPLSPVCKDMYFSRATAAARLGSQHPSDASRTL